MNLGTTMIAGVALATALTACDSSPAPNDKIATIESAISPTLVVIGENLPAVSLEERMKQLNVPGVSIAVINDGTLEWAKAYGFADREENVLATTETLFQAASISKPVAAMAVLKLVDEGRLDLDRNINDLLASWQIPDNEFTVEKKVTLRGLLNHTAGTTVWGFPGYENGTRIPSTVEVLEGAGNTEAIRVFKAPGESWQYSGGGYTAMQLLMSDVRGQPFPQLMQDIVLAPLGMSNSTFEQPLPSAWHARAASGYDSAGNKINGNWHVYPEIAAAGLWTTPSDLARYIMEVQQAYEGDGRVLSEATTHMMLEAGMNDHGLGPIVEDAGSRFAHTGGNAGFRSSFKAFTGQGAGVIVMTNSDNGSLLAQELILTIGREYGWQGLMPDERTVVTLESAVYESMVGIYQVQNSTAVIDVTYDGGQLFIRGVGDRFELLPESAMTFFTRMGGTPVVFERNAEGAVTSLLLGEATRADRVTAD